MIEYTVKVDEEGTKYWYLDRKLHREDGPAVENPYGPKSWYLNDLELTEEEFNARTKTKELTVAEIEALLGYKIKVVA